MKYFLAFILLGAFQAKAHDKAHDKVFVAPKSMTSQKSRPWTNKPFLNGKEQFRFAIVSDRTGGHRPGVFGQSVRILNLLQPEFVMSVGDLIEGYTEDVTKIDGEWMEFDSLVADLKMPFFYVPGNHDYTNEVMKNQWEKRFGRDYYHFVYGDVLFLCLNSEEDLKAHAGGTISDNQYEYIQKTLKNNAGVQWTLLFLHKPLWRRQNTGRWNDVEKLLQDRKHTVFAGHYHRYHKHKENKHNYYTLATTGGGSGLRGRAYGEFDHVVWVTMTSGGPVIANVLLDGVFGDESLEPGIREALQNSIDGSAVVMNPFAEGHENFQSDSMEIKIRNESDFPMKIQFQFREHSQLKTQPQKIRKVLQPNTVEKSKVFIETHGDKIPVTRLEGLEYFYEVEYQDQPGATSWARVEYSSRLLPVKDWNIKAVKAPPKIDGNLDDWQQLRYQCINPFKIEFNPDSWTGPQDGSFLFDISEDKNNLYIAMKVTDDSIVSSSDKRAPWFQDGVEIRLDARPDPVRSGGTGDGEKEKFLLLALCPGDEINISEDGVDSSSAIHSGLPKGTRAVTKTTASGYNVEVSIPLKYVNERQGEKWNAVRINLTQGDFDSTVQDRKNAAQLQWMPDWRSKYNFHGSGTFVRQ